MENSPAVAGARELQVNIVTAQGQRSFEVERDATFLSLKGII